MAGQCCSLREGYLEEKTALPVRAFCLKAMHRVAQLGRSEHATQLAALVTGESDSPFVLVLNFINADGHSRSGNAALAPLESALCRLRTRSSAPAPAP